MTDRRTATSRRSSKARFQEFLERFRRGQIDSHPDESGDGKPNVTDRAVRRSYLRQYAKQLWPHWKLVIVLIFLALAVTALELVQPLFARHIFDRILLADDIPTSDRIRQLHWVGLLFLSIVLVARVLGILRNWYQHLLNMRVILGLRRALYERMLRLPLDRLSDMKVGGIISRLTDDINRTTGLLQMAVISPGVAVIRLLLALAILLVINWKLALTALGVIPPIMLLSMIAIRRIRPIYRAIRKDVAQVDGRVGEAFQGIRAVRAFGGERREELEYNIGHNALTRMRLYATKREIVVWSTWGFLIALISVVITWAGGYWYLKGQATIGDITAFQVYILMLLNPVWQIVESMTELQRSMAAMERVFEVLNTPEDKPDRTNAIPLQQPIRELRFEDVSFHYHNGIDVIHDFNLVVPGGSTVALVGRSGAGKTTITDLVARFYDPTAGRITLNGVDLRDYQLSSYRQALGVVQQEVFLFDGTVAENIAYARPHATRSEIIDAAKRANAHEFIAQLPDGYDSIIGERGVKLSGGQRQRLSIARALLADPQVLILDEATSNLDSESEQLIQQSIRQLIQHRTTFIIAHRLSTITHADLIVVIDEGRIVEIGTHEDLMKTDGVYREMVRRQVDNVADSIL